MNDDGEVDYKETYKQLWEKYQDACITINELNTTIKTLMRMYVRQEEISNALRDQSTRSN